ncbi:MAG: hypothetical protein HBSIN02_22940 [Bacteroidia bacterium]|nr:MAG: hypothetical protein HBSIN02_22940 [Bacteroidia bacterium]
MYWMYVLYSEKLGKCYIGQTNDLTERLIRHNSGGSKYTRSGRPWILIHAEEYKTRGEAVKRERFLKSPSGWLELRKMKEKFSSERGAAR